MKIEDIMVHEPACCRAQTSLQDIAMLMWNNDCGAVPLVDEEQRPVGIVTDRDIAMGAALQHRPLWELRGEDIAQDRAPHCCHPGESIYDVLDLMEQHEVRRFPVVNKRGKLCGMISMGDIVSRTRVGRARKGQPEQIDAGETLDFLRHVSAHHSRQEPAAVS